jgi:hypothetical protein
MTPFVLRCLGVILQEHREPVCLPCVPLYVSHFAPLNEPSGSLILGIPFVASLLRKFLCWECSVAHDEDPSAGLLRPVCVFHVSSFLKDQSRFIRDDERIISRSLFIMMGMEPKRSATRMSRRAKANLFPVRLDKQRRFAQPHRQTTPEIR